MEFLEIFQEIIHKNSRNFAEILESKSPKQKNFPVAWGVAAII